MAEITLILDHATGALLVEAPQRLPNAVRRDLIDLLGSEQDVGCARPKQVLPPPDESADDFEGGPVVRISGYYHNSLIEGPGRRSSVLLSGCDVMCKGCWVSSLHPADAGRLIPVRRVAELLLDPAHERDGVSILGGEPFLQPVGLLALIRELRRMGCPHIVCYSGYTYESLRRRSTAEPVIAEVLDEVEVLIDGPYVEALAASAGPWTGSGNQRVIDLARTRQTGRMVLLDVVG